MCSIEATHPFAAKVNEMKELLVMMMREREGTARLEE